MDEFEVSWISSVVHWNVKSPTATLEEQVIRHKTGRPPRQFNAIGADAPTAAAVVAPSVTMLYGIYLGLNLAKVIASLARWPTLPGESS
jgi:hypothetical protein